MKKDNNEMETTPIKKLVVQYSLPTVIAMLANAIYNMVDRVFIGRFVGETALAGITIVFPLMMMFMALAQLLGGGAAPLIAIRLGKKKPEEAAQIFGNQIAITVITGVTLLIIGMIFGETILRGFGADDSTMAYSLPYFRIIVVGTTFQILAINLSNILRTVGNPKLAMATQLVSALTNLILDFIFVVIFHWGVRGAAYATITGQILGAVWMIIYFLSGKSLLSLHLKYFLLKGKIMREMISLGFSQFITQLGTSFGLTFLNIYLGKFGGTKAIVSIGAINSLYTIFIMPLIGIQIGVLPLISYNFGAGLRLRERDALIYGAKLSIAFAAIVWALMELFPRIALSFFIDPASPTIEMAIPGLRIFVMFLPLLGMQFIGNGYFMATNKPVRAMLLSASRQFILLVPLMVFVLAPLWGLTGVWLATPVSDTLATFFTVLFLRHALNHEDYKKEVKSAA